MDRQRGGFITLEGGEGGGKSTQLAALARRIAAGGREVLSTREPGGSPRAETIRAAILSGAVKPLGAATEAVMFSAARLDHLETLIRPALRRGAVVVCDRFIDSTHVYQGRLGAVDPALLAALERTIVAEDRPDLTLMLDIAPETGLARAAARRRPGDAPDRFERESLAFHAGLRAAFLDIAAREPGRCRVIDADGTPDEVAEAIWAVVLGRLPQLCGAPLPAAAESAA